MKDLLENFIEGFVGAVGISIILFILFLIWLIFRKFYEKSYEKIRKKPYWTEERKERTDLEREKANILENKEKIAEEYATKKGKELGIDFNKDWQEYYRIRKEEAGRLDKRLEDINQSLEEHKTK